MSTSRDTLTVRSGGMGGFLNPPTHPEHDFHVGSARESMCLTTASYDEGIDPRTRKAAKALLTEWESKKPPLESPEVQAWISEVLGYFRGCYRNPHVDGLRQWSASDCIVSDRDPVSNADDHLGVRFIRRFYPTFMPTEAMFKRAKWGK